MPVIVTVTNPGSHGQFFRANGKRRPDSWLFVRNKERTGNYDYTFPTIEEFNKGAEDLLGAQGNPPMKILVVADPGAADTALQKAHEAALAELQKELKARGDRIDDLATTVNLQRTQIVELEEGGKAGLTEEQVGQLQTYNQFLEILSPLAGEGDQPLDVLKRLLPAEEGQAEELNEKESVAPGSEPKKAPDGQPAPTAAPSPAKGKKAAGKANGGAKKAKAGNKAEKPQGSVETPA